jgi:hypothetical protein
MIKQGGIRTVKMKYASTFWSESLKGDHLGILGVYERIILKYNYFKRIGCVVDRIQVTQGGD